MLLELTQLQQGFATGGMGSDRQFAWQQSSRPDVRFGSKADIKACPRVAGCGERQGARLAVRQFLKLSFGVRGGL